MHAVMRSINPSNSSCLGQPVLLRAEALPGDEVGAVHVLGRLDGLDQELCSFERLSDARVRIRTRTPRKLGLGGP
jgi:hypothetical protein